MVLMSTADEPSPGTCRLPLTRTKVRVVPRPRRSRRLRPVVPRNRVEFEIVNVLRIDGRSLRTSPTETTPLWKNSSPPTEVTGSGDSRFGRRMREPVTTIEALQVGELGFTAQSVLAFWPDSTSCSAVRVCGASAVVVVLGAVADSVVDCVAVCARAGVPRISAEADTPRRSEGRVKLQPYVRS